MGAGAEKGTLPRIDCASCKLRVGVASYDNLVRLPVDASEPTNLHIELVGQGVLDVEGNAVRVESVGEPRYIEDLPPDMRPSD